MADEKKAPEGLEYLDMYIQARRYALRVILPYVLMLAGSILGFFISISIALIQQ